METTAIVVLSLSSLLVVAGGDEHVNLWLVKLKPLMTVDDHVALAKSSGLISRGHVGHLKHMFQFELPRGSHQEYANITEALAKNFLVEYVEQEKKMRRVKRSFLLPDDPSWKYQWQLFNIGQSGSPEALDIDVVPVWMQGITGSGTYVAVIDDGVEITHPDLKNNIDMSISYSYIRNNSDPSPLFSLPEYSHGTSCAGEIAMEHDNDICGVGVAYNTNLGGIQIDLEALLPSDEASALTYNYQTVQVYSNSYGPDDGGFTVAGPSTVSQESLIEATSHGRNGLGNIYVFASGNGGDDGDSCASDGYASSIYTIAVGSVDQAGNQAFYDENCPAKMAVTYSYNNVFRDEQLVTTHVNNECVRNFTGTSASAPLLAGVIALVLEVNPNLSWRDVQYLIVYTSDPSSLSGGAGWITNAAGLNVSSSFGFGAIDAEAMVNRARHWVPVETSSIVSVSPSFNRGALVTRNEAFQTSFQITGTRITYLEHVILTVSFSIFIEGSERRYSEEDYDENPNVINHSGPRRGDATITLCSPGGTCSRMLPKRPRDFVTSSGYDDWPFMSVQFWGENPTGVWTVSMEFDSSEGGAVVTSLGATLHGVPTVPASAATLGTCNASCARGCSNGTGSQYCDKCASGYYRNLTTFECVDSCSACVIEDVCVFYDGSCPRYSFNPGSPPIDVNLIIASVCASAAVALFIIVSICVCVCLCRSRSCRCKKYDLVEVSVDEEPEYQAYVT